MAVVVAPAIGPTLGGWITDNFNWHWIFFINLPVGLLSLFFTSRLVEDPPWLRERKGAGIKIDYIGLSLLVTGVACFQFVLDKGQESDWFSSPSDHRVDRASAFRCSPRSSSGSGITRNPIVDVRLLKNRNFGTAVCFSFVLGMVLFGSTVLIPEFLQSSLGYTAELAGPGALTGGLCADVHDVRGRPPHRHQNRSAPAHLYRIPGHLIRAALDDQHLSPDRFRHHCPVALFPGDLHAADLHSHQHAELRRRAARKEQSGLRHFQLHAQHRRQHRNLRAQCLSSAPESDPPGRPSPRTPAWATRISDSI